MMDFEFYLESGEAFSLSRGHVPFVLTLWRRKVESRGKGTKVGVIVGKEGESLADLLETMARLLRQHGDLEGVARVMTEAKEKSY
jgi:hypothetical protein